MSAEQVRAVTLEAQAAWATGVRAFGSTAAEAAMRQESPEALAFAIRTILQANAPRASEQGAATVDQALAAAGRPPAAPAPPAPPAVLLTTTILRAWERARAAAGPGETISTAYLRSELARMVSDSLTDSMRDGMTRAMSRHRDIRGWRRVSRDGCCGACLALTDGSIHPAAERLTGHPRCRCFPEPVIRGVNDDAFGRPTGQQRWDAMSEAEQDAMFLGHGGREKAARIRELGGLERLVTNVPRHAGTRPLVRETSLNELR